MGGARIGRTFGVCAPARRRCAVPCARCGSAAQTIRNPPRARKFAACAKIRRGASRCSPRPPPPLPRGGAAPYLAAAAAEDPTAALLQAAGAPLALRAPLGGASAPVTELRPDRATAPSSFNLLAFEFQRKNSRWLLIASRGFRGRRLFVWLARFESRFKFRMGGATLSARRGTPRRRAAPSRDRPRAAARRAAARRALLCTTGWGSRRRPGCLAITRGVGCRGGSLLGESRTETEINALTRRRRWRRRGAASDGAGAGVPRS